MENTAITQALDTINKAARFSRIEQSWYTNVQSQRLDKHTIVVERYYLRQHGAVTEFGTVSLNPFTRVIECWHHSTISGRVSVRVIPFNSFGEAVAYHS